MRFWLESHCISTLTWKNGHIHRKVQIPKENQEEIEIMNRPITNTEIETVI